MQNKPKSCHSFIELSQDKLAISVTFIIVVFAVVMVS